MNETLHGKKYQTNLKMADKASNFLVQKLMESSKNLDNVPKVSGE
jgi:hypothetical protein